MASGILGGVSQLMGVGTGMSIAELERLKYKNSRVSDGYEGMRNSIQPALPTSPMVCHAERLHKLAEELQQLNSRLMGAIDHIAGPIPESTGGCGGGGGAGPALLGFLGAAQCGADGVSGGINRLSELVTRLEGIV